MEQLVDAAETKVVNVRRMPVETWRQLKIRAALENSTIQATVTRAIEHYLKSDET